MRRAGQPYTRVVADKTYTETETSDGKKGLIIEDCLSIRGYTLEEQFQPDQEEGEEPTYAWQEIDLGQRPTLDEAHTVAAEWRESLRGIYPIG